MKPVDTHMHIFFDVEAAQSISDERVATPENVLKSIRDNGISKAWVLVMAQKGNINETSLLNDKLLEFYKNNKNVIVPVGSVHPDDKEDALNELIRISKLGIKIIKLHPNTQKFDVASPSVEALAKKAGDLETTLLFDSYSPFDANQMGKFVELAIKNPKTKFILAHMGGVRFMEILVFDVLNQYPWYAKNVWFDVSYVMPTFADSPYHHQLAWIIRKVGVEKFVFGSDYPIFDQREALQSIDKFGFTDDEKKKLVHDNAEVFLLE